MSFISYAQNFEDVMLWRALKKVDKGFYIDVGANDPEDDSVTKAFYDRGWDGINIEPEKRFFEKLQQHRIRDINLDVAISDRKGAIEIYMFETRGWSTGNKEVAEAHRAEGREYKIEKIQTQSLDSICREHHVDEVHFLKIDVEGAEKSVLQSFSFDKVRPWIIVIEATKPNTNIDISSEWEDILFNHNYQFAYFDGINKFYISAEHIELLEAFKSPPNTLDDFIRAAQYLTEQKATSCIDELARSVTHIQHLEKTCKRLQGFETECATLRRQNQELLLLKTAYETLQQQQQEMIQSHSWKMTYPLRLVVQSLRKQKKKHPEKQLLLDLSQVYFHDDGTGIQRVIHHIRQEIPALLSDAYLLMPVYATQEKSYHYTAKFGPEHPHLIELDEQPVTVRQGDIFLGLDLGAHLFPMIEETLLSYRKQGVSINFVIYDIIPLLYPHYTTEGIALHFKHWIDGLVTCADRLICISQSVAGDVQEYLASHYKNKDYLPEITTFRLGADLGNNQHLPPMREEVQSILQILKDKDTFLMVGTLEPRKGQEQVLDAFDLLWEEDADITLLFVGKEGWKTEKLTERIKNHPYLNSRLFWLQDANDQELIESYKASTCFIMASYAEGFGLPIIEAAYYGVPIIARDIPVFREIAQEHAYYFNSIEADAIKEALNTWLSLYRADTYPRSDNIQQLRWRESTQQLLKCLEINTLNMQKNK